MRALALSFAGAVLLAAAAAIAFWWAGFAPFPTEPVTLAGYNVSLFCTVRANNWAKCDPDEGHPTPKGDMDTFRLFADGKESDASYGEYGQWGIEGWNGCWDAGCAELFNVPDITFQWKIYNKTEVPHFGLGAPRWVRAVAAYNTVSGLDGVFAQVAYTTYSACMYRRPADTNTEYYKCVRLQPDDPWRVGKIHD
jgi:hypothetical protein